jgi:hypothetical protein
LIESAGLKPSEDDIGAVILAGLGSVANLSIDLRVPIRSGVLKRGEARTVLVELRLQRSHLRHKSGCSEPVGRERRKLAAKSRPSACSTADFGRGNDLAAQRD